MIKFLDKSGSINYCFCTVLVSCTVMYSLVKSYIHTFLVKIIYVAHYVHQLLFKTWFRTNEIQYA